MAKSHHVKSSALDQIDATIQPMGPQPALRAEVDQLVKLNDIRHWSRSMMRSPPRR